jgi:hypothetical protein
MASAPTRGAVAEPPELGDSAAADPYLTPSAAAWLCAIPCALVVLLLLLVLGPTVGSLLDAPRHYRFLPFYTSIVRPEPTELGRFLVALSAPILLSLATVATLRRRPRLERRRQTIAIGGIQLALAALIVACVAEQYRAQYDSLYILEPGWIRWIYFTPATLATGAAIASGIALALRLDRSRDRLVAALRESRGRRAAVTACAIAMTAVWLLHAIHTDHSVANAPWRVGYHMGFTLDEAFAVINGRTPLVDFSSQYASLLAWVGALSLLAFGKTLLVFTITMCALTALALLALFGVLRMASRSAVAALLLFLPVLATSFFKVDGSWLERHTFASYFGAFPLRFAGPYLLAWLTARQLERSRDRPGSWPLFLLSGLVLLNNLETGVAALAATIAAIVWTAPPTSRSLLRLGGAVAAGLAAALGLVSLLTLLHAGSLPRLWRLADYAQLYGRGGFSLLPILSPFGLHLVIYMTYVAAIATATVRALNRAPNRVLTGMLAWSGSFGLVAGSYFAGRSHPEALVASFSTWALTVALLVIVVAARLLAEPRRRPSLGALLVLLGFGIAICSLVQTPVPWSQLRRFDEPFRPAFLSVSERPLLPERRPATIRFVSSIADGPAHFVVRKGAPVAILAPMGHRIADAYGIVDVSPYTGWNSMETAERVEATLDALRDTGGNTAIVPRDVPTTIFLILARHGFKALTRSGRLASFGPRHPVAGIALVPWQDGWLTKWVDTRHLRPRALR